MSDIPSEDLGALNGASAPPPPDASGAPPVQPAATPPPPPPPVDPGEGLLQRLKSQFSRKAEPAPPPPQYAQPQPQAAPGGELLTYPGYELDFAKVFDNEDRPGAAVALQRMLTETARATHAAATADASSELQKTVKNEKDQMASNAEAQSNIAIVREYIMKNVDNNPGAFKIIAPMFAEHLHELAGGDPAQEMNPENIQKAFAMAKKTLAETVAIATAKRSPDSGTPSMTGSTPQNAPKPDPFLEFVARHKATEGFRG